MKGLKGAVWKPDKPMYTHRVTWKYANSPFNKQISFLIKFILLMDSAIFKMRVFGKPLNKPDWIQFLQVCKSTNIWDRERTINWIYKIQGFHWKTLFCPVPSSENWNSATMVSFCYKFSFFLSGKNKLNLELPLFYKL